jgi:hypothetical protein
MSELYTLCGSVKGNYIGQFALPGQQALLHNKNLQAGNISKSAKRYDLTGTRAILFQSNCWVAGDDLSLLDQSLEILKQSLAAVERLPHNRGLSK